MRASTTVAFAGTGNVGRRISARFPSGFPQYPTHRSDEAPKFVLPPPPLWRNVSSSWEGVGWNLRFAGTPDWDVFAIIASPGLPARSMFVVAFAWANSAWVVSPAEPRTVASETPGPVIVALTNV